MADWIIGGLFGLLALVAVKKMLSWQVFGRKRGREDFESLIRYLLITRENGGSLHVQRRRSDDLAFDFVRAPGDHDDDAVVLLRLPRAPRSRDDRQKLDDAFDAQDLDVRTVEEGDSGGYWEIRIPVENIWEEWCGAKSARVSHILLDALDVPKDARFDCSLAGSGSYRWREHEKKRRQMEVR